MKKFLLIVPAVVLLAAACNQQPAVQQNTQTSNPPAQQQTNQTPPPAQTTPPPSQTANWQTYNSSQYGFSFQYPIEWSVTDNGSTIDSTNKILSSISAGNGKQNFNVTVDENKPQGYVYQAPKKVSVTISGGQYTAYIFPSGYECYGDNPDPSTCSFFSVPINKNGKWFTLSASGQAESINNEPYKTILSSFKFTK